MAEYRLPLAPDTAHSLSLGQRLRQERERHHWSQEQLAAVLGEQGVIVNLSSIYRWEHDLAVPRPYYRDLLCRVFTVSHETLFGPLEGSVAASAEPPLWMVPYLRNRYFTGRDDVLSRLHTMLTQQQTLALTALSGLGGVGKTQTALEYAYRYGEEYDSVLWLHAESLQALLSDYVLLAESLHLPERQEAEQMRAVKAVLRWLQHTTRRWLLILDNVEQVEQVEAFLPTRGTGHLLLTTRSQAMGAAMECIELDSLSQQEGALLLLRRAKLLGTEASLEQAAGSREAEIIYDLVGGLPLALDQAGAYIEENQCRLADYQRLYQARRADLLRRAGRGGARTTSHVVATTWTLSFEQVEQLNPAAADLLRLCAFLHPDGIPEAMLLAGQAELGPVLQPLAADPLLWDEAIGVLRRYSLLRRIAETKMLTLHLLVQVVLKDAMAPEVYRAWAERAVRVVSRAFPEPEMDYDAWAICQAYLSHALLCADLIEHEEMGFPEAARLLHQAGRYLYERGQYAQAERLLTRALLMRERMLGTTHADVAATLSALALLSYSQGNYQQATLLNQRALTIREHVLGTEHPETAKSLDGLAASYRMQGKYEQAEPLLQRALLIRERILGAEHPDTAKSLNSLARLYGDQGTYKQAELLFRRALTIYEQQLGPTHPFTIVNLNNLGITCHYLGKYAEAEPLLERAVLLCEQVLGPTHSYTAENLNCLGFLYRSQGKYARAEECHVRALSIQQHALGAENYEVAASLNALAMLAYDQGRYEQAEHLLRRVLAMQEQLGLEHSWTSEYLSNLALSLSAQGQYEQVEPLFQRVLGMREQQLGSAHPDTARSLTGLAALYRDQGHYEQAEPLFQQALAVLEERLGAGHPTVAEVLEQYALLLHQTQREAEAKALEARADAIYLTYAQQGIQLPRLSRGEKTPPLHQQKEDPLAPFLVACCELDPLASVSANELWQAYWQWCQDTREQALLHRRAFATSLQARGCQPDRTRTSRIWRGVRLVESRRGFVGSILQGEN